MSERFREHKVQIVGGGPGGIGPLVAADRRHDGIQEFLSGDGVVVINPDRNLGAGAIGSYKIRSNSAASDFHEGVRRNGIFEDAFTTEEARRLEQYGDEAIPLIYVGGFLGLLGQHIGKALEDHPTSGVVEAKVGSVHQTKTSRGDIVYETRDPQGRALAQSRNVVLAAGAVELVDPSLQNYREKLFLSQNVIAGVNLEEIHQKVAKSDRKQVVVIGGSHSSFSTVWKLLDHYEGNLPFDLTILHRSPIRVFYERESDITGTDQYDQEDICPKTKRVNRFSGLRGDAKATYRAIQNGEVHGVSIQQFQAISQVESLLSDSAVIIQSTGYTPREIPIFNGNGEVIGPRKSKNGQVAVTEDARVEDLSGQVIKGVYATGLGYGIRPSTEIGGEPSFKGPLDGVNVYHGSVGEKIANNILREEVVFAHV